MSPARKMLTVVSDVIVLLLLLVLTGGTLVVGNALSKFSWEEMDWQDRGKTSWRDVYAAIERDKRTFVSGDKICVDYYSLRDGLTVKTVCREDPNL